MCEDESVYSVGVDEFEAPSAMYHFYCNKMTAEEYEEEAETETEIALKVTTLKHFIINTFLVLHHNFHYT